jgi:hypothetical protein
MALVGTLAGQHVVLVVTVEVHIEGLVGRAEALQQLRLDVGSPTAAIRVGTDSSAETMSLISVCGCTLPGPAHQRRHAITTLPIGILLAAERRGAAVGPGECLGAVVRRVDHDRVVGDAEVVELAQKLTDLAVVFHHAVRIAKPGFPSDSGLVLAELSGRVAERLEQLGERRSLSDKPSFALPLSHHRQQDQSCALR